MSERATWRPAIRAAPVAAMLMDAHQYEYRSDFARQYLAQGRLEGRAALIAGSWRLDLVH